MSSLLETVANNSSQIGPQLISNQSHLGLWDYYAIYDDKWMFYKDLIIFGLYTLTVLLSLFGNLIVCYVCFVLRPKSITYLLIGNMAVSDLLGAIAIPLQWLFCSTHFLDANDRFCGTFKSLQVVSYFISTWDMALISIDRFMILHNPLAKRVKPLTSIAIIWVVALLINIPTLVAMRVSEYFTPTRLVYCRIIFRLNSELTGQIRKYRVDMVVLTQYFIPLLIATIFYTLCIKKILSRQRIGEFTNQQEARFYQSKMRTIKMLFIALGAFAFSWLPVHLCHLIDFHSSLSLMPKQCNSSFAYNFFYWLAVSSICYNPFIYCSFDAKFRSTARMFFCCCCCTNRGGAVKSSVRQLLTTTNNETPQRKNTMPCTSDASTS